MRIPVEFPDGFGSDPTVMFGPGASAMPPAAASAAAVALLPFEITPRDPTSNGDGIHQPGPFHASFEPAGDADLHAGPGSVTLDPRGFHIDASSSQDMAERAPWIEPQGVVVTALVVGAILAAMGYFLDMG